MAIPEVLRPPGQGRGVPMPWWAKLAAKVALARLPLDYRAWARLGLFRHGRSDRDPEKPIADAANAIGAWAERRGNGAAPGTALELGPGDSVATALAAAALGVRQPLLMDVGDFATRDMMHYAKVALRLGLRGAPILASLESREALLADIGARYLTGGIPDLAALPDGSVDLTWSVTVLEHVPRAEMPLLLAELHRITAPGGMGWHGVDLTDHLGGGLNSLRFRETLWEAPWFATRSGFYTNRLRQAELLALARAAGFRASVAWRERWPRPPLPRARMAKPFRAMEEAELDISAVCLLLEKPEA